MTTSENKPRSVLIVDDEEALRFFVGEALAAAGWEVTTVDSGEAALVAMDGAPRDLMLLDLRMPGMNGVTVMETVKERWPETMVVVMTAYASLESAIAAVRQGAFDYLRKPCKTEKVLAVAERAWQEKQTRRQEKKEGGRDETAVSANRLLQTGELLINRGAHTVHRNQKPISLTPTESALLMLLAERPGQAVPLERLIREGLGYDPADPQAQETLRVHISRMRRKIGTEHVRTARGGYLLAMIPR